MVTITKFINIFCSLLQIATVLEFIDHCLLASYYTSVSVTGKIYLIKQDNTNREHGVLQNTKTKYAHM